LKYFIELDVLARAERIGGEVRAAAVVVARPRSTDRHAIGTAASRIRDLEFGEDGLGSVVLEREGLLAPELPPELPLPRFE
jgi:hypothetical protein